MTWQEKRNTILRLKGLIKLSILKDDKYKTDQFKHLLYKTKKLSTSYYCTITIN